MTEYRRILLGGAVVEVRRDGEDLVAGDGRRVGAAEAVHLPPVTPTKIIAVHLNHLSRVTEFGAKLPPAPTYFQKPVSALVAHGGAVVRPTNCKYLNYEGEVAIVIGRTCRNVPRSQAGEYIAGYTIANDFGLHDFRDTDAGSMLRVKGSDTMAPLGPGLVTGWDFRGNGCAPTSTAAWHRTGRPTRCTGTCTTWSPTSRARSRCAPATCCCPGRPQAPARCSRETWSTWKSTGSAG